jgi:predicted aconitase with swiveling domain
MKGCGVTDRVLLAGNASGPALVLDEPLSMWGGFDTATGAIIDRRHPQAGMIATGTVLVMQCGRGSSSSSSVLAEAIRLGTAPAAIVIAEADDILLLGALVAEQLYGIICPVVVAGADTYAKIHTGDEVEIGPGGARVGRR